MSKELNKIADSLFDKIRSRFEDISLGDSNAKATQNPEDARFFNFDYSSNGRNYGNITISIIDEQSLKVYFSKNISDKLDDTDKKTWINFLKELRFFARRNLLTFEPRDITRGTLKHRDIQQVSNNDDMYSKDDVQLGESLSGTRKVSYEQKGPVNIIVRHNKSIDDERRGSRTRNIQAIFLETHDGERFKLPENSLKLARAMARHLSEGGAMHDEFGKHILDISAQSAKLRPFKASMGKRTFENVETQQMAEAAFEYHGLLNNTLKRMAGKKGYKHCKENYTADNTLMDDVDVDSVKERFVKRVYNDKLEGAFPLVQKAYDMKKQNKFAAQFESWANRITNHDSTETSTDDEYNDETIRDLIVLLSLPLEVGVDAINAINALDGIISNEQLNDDLLDMSNENPEEDARHTILDWLEHEEPELYQMVLDDVSKPSEEELDEVRGERDHDREREEHERQQPNWNDDEEDEYDPDEHENEADYRYQQEKDARATGELEEDDYDNRRISEWKIKFNLSDGHTHYEFVEAYTSQEAKPKIKELIKKVSASYKGTDEEVRHISYSCISGPEMGGRSLGEGEVDEAKGDIRKALAGAALAGGLALGGHAMDKAEYASSPQLQKLEQLHSQAVKVGHSKLASDIADRIENHKARLAAGHGEVRTASGAPKEVHESLSDIRKLAGLLKG